MRRSRLHRACQAKLAGFQVPRPFSIEALCAQVARSRGRELHLHPLPYPHTPDLPCGIWIATADADHIVHAHGASALHQQNIILHEIGHMLCDHTVTAGSDLAALLTDLDPAMVRRVLARTRYSTPQEEEAEMVAALIMRQAGWAPGPPRPGGPLGRLSDVFGLTREP
ncbi:hypothetical protein [Actinophytocola sp.]|uniref:hypothetical protein n=1 Tax=Actinophytocola sp. TaxID=1872138 RepID=UPI002D7EEA98|nr:hypothetical protein [Actinophytocola sp.]HET9141840.1 hypothetical protein [Actinophytocola sp.]